MPRIKRKTGLRYDLKTFNGGGCMAVKNRTEQGCVGGGVWGRQVIRDITRSSDRETLRRK